MEQGTLVVYTGHPLLLMWWNLHYNGLDM